MSVGITEKGVWEMPIVNIINILLLLPFCIIPALYNKHLDKKQEKEWKERLNRQ